MTKPNPVRKEMRYRLSIYRDGWGRNKYQIHVQKENGKFYPVSMLAAKRGEHVSISIAKLRFLSHSQDAFGEPETMWFDSPEAAIAQAKECFVEYWRGLLTNCLDATGVDENSVSVDIHLEAGDGSV